MQLRASVVAIACASTCFACGPRAENERGASEGPLQGRFYVSDEFAPSGHMGDGEQAGFIFADIDERCTADASKGEQGPSARAANVGGDCYRFTYKPDLRPGADMWAGVYWVYPANNWGALQGRTVIPPFKRIRFKAAAEPRGPDPSNPMTRVEPRVSFIVGGIGTSASDPQPFRDEISDRAVKNAYLTPQWQDLEIDLTGFLPETPFHMISGFGWTTNYQPGVPTPESPPTVIYIDDIVWDTE
jgi:hypothetical protein